MKRHAAIFFVVISCALQLTVMPKLIFFGSFPDLILISLVIVTLSAPWRFVLVLSICAGMFKDAVGTNPVGMNTLLFPLWALAVVQATRRFSIDSNLNRSVLIFAICLLHAIAMRIFSLCLGVAVPLGVGLRIVLWGSLYTAVASTVVLRLAPRR